MKHPRWSAPIALAILLLAGACEDEAPESAALVSVGDDGVSSALVAILDQPLESVEASTAEGEELLLWERHLTISNIQPGDYAVDLTLNGIQRTLLLPDLRPQTTAVVYLRQRSGSLEVAAHRRFSADFEQDDRPDLWQVELLEAP